MNANIWIPLELDSTDKFAASAIMQQRNMALPITLATRAFLPKLNFFWNSLYVANR